ncbi:glutathione S-transferase family protein [Anaeromyxobacter terrae]|uniref:glutathione S-transferase family protein n=1 Tax=Anaeromyxobacter terrae TaxID=2925406 RepID=UPI001F567364|nr:glutathione S-transferase family protein [Anaeromyxobacter sp. SG22]
MPRLYYVPHTRASRPRIVLEELGIPYELVRLDPAKAETRTSEHLARHPLGHVPALEDGEVSIFESGAICFWLAERYGEGRLLPPPGTPGRALAYQWLCFALSELEPPLSPLAAELKKPEAERDPARIEGGRARFHAAAKAVDAALAGRDFLLGDELSVVDVVVAAILSYGKFLAGLQGMPTAEAYVLRLRGRPAWKRATAD